VKPRRLLLPALAALLALVLDLGGFLDPAELLLRDGLLRLLPVRPARKVALVLIDEAALRAVGPWPWTWAQLGQLVLAAFRAGARGVALDLLLPEPREGDAVLDRALASGPSALAAGLDEVGAWLLPNPRLHPGAVGHVSFDLDRDGVVRRFSSTKQAGRLALPALAVAAARLAEPGMPIPVGVTLRPGFRARPIPAAGAAALLAARPTPALQGRIVFLGLSAAGLGDRFVSPVSRAGSPDPGVVIEALATEAVLARDLLRPANPLAGAALVFALGLLGSLLLGAPGRIRPLLAPLLVLAPLPLAAAALAGFGQELMPAAMTAGLLLAVAAAAAARLRQARRAFAKAGGRIKELEALQSDLAESRARDREAQRVVAHELKTPLTSVKGLAQLLAKFDLSGAEKDRVTGLVVAETSRLAQMVDALLDLERLGLRDFEASAEPLDFSALCAGRAESLSAGPEGALAGAIAPGLRVRGDRLLLERVIENLVGNARKFSPPGTQVRLELRAEGPWAVLEVADRGPGIPGPERQRIFGRFARGSAQAAAPGLGLGLALVAEAAAWHRGAVQVDDSPGGGARFRVRLPLASQSAR
jgi:signal transduction histidine kinase